MRTWLFAIIAIFCFTQCSDDDMVPPKGNIAPTPFVNNPLPTDVDTLRVLAIGNSYTQNSTCHLHCILDSTDIASSRLALYVAYIPSASLKTWWEQYLSHTPIDIKRYAGAYKMHEHGTLAELMHQDWDIIVFQQYSRQSDRYSTFNPYLANLRRAAQAECTNPKVCFAWNMTWNYWTKYVSYPVNASRYYSIANAARQVVNKNNIDVLIPTGTAIENARNIAALNNGLDLTIDGTHLAPGVATYIAACTWFERILHPAFGKGITGTRLTMTVHNSNNDRRNYVESVRPDNYMLCQKCALAAIEAPYNITYIE